VVTTAGIRWGGYRAGAADLGLGWRRRVSGADIRWGGGFRVRVVAAGIGGGYQMRRRI
jgi:hypothetical protein